jgi:hypothetical protein
MSTIYRDKLDILCSGLETGMGLPRDLPLSKREAYRPGPVPDA